MNPSTQEPTQGRAVHVKYLNTAGVVSSLDTLPGTVVRVLPPALVDGPPQVRVTVFGDGVPDAPTMGAHTIRQAVPLYDATNPENAQAGAGAVTVPPDATVMRGGPWDGKPVWCEWPPAPKPKANGPAAKPAS